MTRSSIRSAIAGTEVGPLRHDVDARWLMAYAAGLGETDARYYDTLRSAGPLAHPIFAVCYEWPVALEVRAVAIQAELAPLGVHATHHLTIHRPPRAGDALLTSARIVRVARRPRGTLVTTRFTTVDERGAPVTTTDYGSFYRGVECDGDATVEPAAVGAWTSRHARPADDAAATHAADDAEPTWTESVPIPAEAAHVYTECARIWNPIHTDIAVAKAAGLPGLILHGTATLALAVSRVVRRELAGEAERVREVTARFTGMVLMPSTVTVRRRRDDALAFDAVSADGQAVLSDGRIRT